MLLGQQIQPQLGLEQHQRARLNAPQRAAHGERQVEREVDEVVHHIAQRAEGGLLSCRCGGAEHEFVVGQQLAQAPDDGLRRQRLADRHAVNPHARLVRRRRHGHEPQSLRPAVAP
jgi:hypothetical protein